MHCFNNYFGYSIYIISSNLLYFIYIFRLNVNKIKRRREDVEDQVLFTERFYKQIYQVGQKNMNYEK